jgi:dolichyl-phosphate-mannose-protein mannosyltransferase
MAATSTPPGSLRQRNVATSSKKKDAGGVSDVEIETAVKAGKAAPLKAAGAGKETEYKITLVIITVLAFVTRFWGISHPNEVVFDEVHFGKVRRRQL